MISKIDHLRLQLHLTGANELTVVTVTSQQDSGLSKWQLPVQPVMETLSKDDVSISVLTVLKGVYLTFVFIVEEW